MRTLTYVLPQTWIYTHVFMVARIPFERGTLNGVILTSLLIISLGRNLMTWSKTLSHDSDMSEIKQEQKQESFYRAFWHIGINIVRRKVWMNSIWRHMDKRRWIKHELGSHWLMLRHWNCHCPDVIPTCSKTFPTWSKCSYSTLTTLSTILLTTWPN